MKQPNFLIIHTDQQRYDCISAANRRTGIYTPFIDSIGHRGAHFTSCYATCPVCIPQRMSLLTGQLPQTHGLFTNMGIPYFPLETTLPAEMRRGGYQTALVGRTMHTYPFTHPYGFEYYEPGDPSSEYKETIDPFFKYLRDNNVDDCGGYYGAGAFNNSRVAVPFHLDDHFHQTKWATNRAIDFLKNRDNSRPYMLFVGFYAPHSPHNPPVNYFERYYTREDLDDPYISEWDVPPKNNSGVMSSYINLKGEELRAARAGYYGNIAFLDAQIGRLLNVVDKDTYVIFTSDHGDMLGDHYMYQKSRPYEGSAHIPLQIMGPGIDGGQTLDQPVGWHDLMPTILDLAGLPVPDSVDGESLAPMLRAHDAVNGWREYLHGECFHHYMGHVEENNPEKKHNYFFEKGSHFLTDGKMKYIWYVTSGKEQLFNVSVDWKEAHNLALLPEHQQELLLWRSRLAKVLADRPEGYSDGKTLAPGCTPLRVTEKVQKIIRQRKAEGFQLAYAKAPNPLENLDYDDHLLR